VTLKEFRDWLAQIEHAYPVYEWHVDGLQVWPMIRLMTHGANFQGRSEGAYVGAGARAYLRVLARTLVNWSRATIADRRHNERPDGRADAVFLAYSIGRQPVIEGRRYNPLVAPYVEVLKRRGMQSRVWEMSPHGEYNLPRHTPSAFVQPRLLQARIESLARPGIRLRESLAGFNELAADAAAAGWDFPYRERQRLHRDVYCLRTLARLFGRWLDRVRPSVVFVSDTSLREQALCVACRQRGITTVEVQHGVQHGNPAYAEWNAVPVGGLTSRARVFWSWDESSAGALEAWVSAAPAAHRVVLGGDPWRDMWTAEDDAHVAAVKADVRARQLAVGGTKHILVTLSSIEEVVPEVIVGAIRQSPPDWRWWFRMHPVNQARRRRRTEDVVRTLGGDIALMTFATEAPLFALLRMMDAHVTAGFSTVVQQAAAFGVPSVGCAPAIGDLYAAEVAQGWVRVAPTADAMHRALMGFLSCPRPHPPVPPARGHAAMAVVLGLAPPAGWA
jgi:hypothetical protein